MSQTQRVPFTRLSNAQIPFCEHSVAKPVIVHKSAHDEPKKPASQTQRVEFVR